MGSGRWLHVYVRDSVCVLVAMHMRDQVQKLLRVKTQEQHG